MDGGNRGWYWGTGRENDDGGGEAVVAVLIAGEEVVR